MKIGELEDIANRLNQELRIPKGLGKSESLRCIEICTQYLQEIKAMVKEREFASTDEEIYFFKKVKPLITSKYFYYLKLYKIEMATPMSSTDVKIRYYKKEISKLDNYTTSHADFCTYIRRDATYLDHIYFTRGNKSPDLFTNYQVMDFEEEFATSHGFVLARILASESLYIHLRKKIQLLENNYAIVDSLLSPIQWKGSKANLVVLMYGLITTGQVDCDISTLANQLQKLFDIELKDTYRIWADIKTRKKDLFPWLKEMVEKLEDRARE